MKSRRSQGPPTRSWGAEGPQTSCVLILVTWQVCLRQHPHPDPGQEALSAGPQPSQAARPAPSHWEGRPHIKNGMFLGWKLVSEIQKIKLTFSFHISLEILSRKKSTLLHIFSKLILNQCFQQTQYLEKNCVGSLSPTGTVKEDRDLRRGEKPASRERFPDPRPPSLDQGYQCGWTHTSYSSICWYSLRQELFTSWCAISGQTNF